MAITVTIQRVKRDEYKESVVVSGVIYRTAADMTVNPSDLGLKTIRSCVVTAANRVGSPAAPAIACCIVSNPGTLGNTMTISIQDPAVLGTELTAAGLNFIAHGE